MEENSKDIQCLIKLKKQRPSFSRMISWEMSQTTDIQYGKKVRQKKKQKDRDETDPNTVGDDKMEDVNDDEETNSGSAVSSDYETANEDVVDELELSQAFSSINTETSFDTADVADQSDLDSEGDDDADDAFESVPANAASGGLQPGRRRRPSKRQKRNKSKLFRVTYIDEFANLGDLFNMDNDIETACINVSENQDNIDICSPVPTLAELSLKATRQRRKRNQSGQSTTTNTPLPIGIKRIITDWRYNQRALDKQLSFFLNFVLPSTCEKDNIKQNEVYYHEKSDKYSLKFPVRSVWCSVAHPVEINTNFQYPSDKATAFLYNPSLRKVPPDILNQITWTDAETYEKLHVSSTHIQSALATTIDLMLSSTLSDRMRQGSSSTDSEAIEKASKTAIHRVKNALSSRYPHLVNHLFERVLPYVMWARGNISLATQMFQSMVQKETNKQYKAMYLSEIGCMHSMFGDSGTATSFYKLASEVIISEETLLKDKVIAEVSEQTQILMASAYDCGRLTPEKAVKSICHWESAIKLATPKQSTVLAAVDSLLGLHMGHLSGDCWTEAEGRLKSWLPSNSYLQYYLSLLLALRGNGPDSTKEFREFRTFCHTSLPGDIIFPFLEKSERKNPWNPLITIVKSQRVPVKPLKVVWRTQLRFPRLTNEKSMEGDIISPPLNLYISENGHLTGDIQMLMPPIRQVELDLYTGSLVLTNVPSFTGTWQMAWWPPQEYIYSDFMVPTPSQIFSDENGAEVHLVAPSLYPCNRSSYNGYLPRCPMLLTWKGQRGQTARINLITVAKEYCKEIIDKGLADKTLFTKYDGKDMDLLKALIDVAYAKNLSLNHTSLDNAVKSVIRSNKSNAKKKKKQTTAKEPIQEQKGGDAKHIRSMIPKHLNTFLGHIVVHLRDKPFQFSQGVVVPLKIEDRSAVMVLDTSSRESFLDYKLLKYSVGADSFEIKNRPDAKFFMVYKDGGVQILNEKAVECDFIDIKELNRCDHPNNDVHLCILGDYVFGVNKSRLNVWRHTIGTEFLDFHFDINTAPSLAPYWELPDDRKQIENLKALGTQEKGKGHFLFLHLSVGLGFMDPDTLEMIPISLPDDCTQKLTDDGKLILGSFRECQVHPERFFTEDEIAVCRFAVSTENKVFLFDMRHKLGSDELQASLIAYLFLPGIVKEVCIVGKEVGLLVSFTQLEETDTNYREHVFHFRTDGSLNGTLLCLGQGPRSFFPFYLRGNEDGSKEPGWYVYMRDGHDGILGVKLF